MNSHTVSYQAENNWYPTVVLNTEQWREELKFEKTHLVDHYQAGADTAACSLEDIKTNNMLFSLLYFPEKPRIFSLPLFNYPGEENF